MRLRSLSPDLSLSLTPSLILSSILSPLLTALTMVILITPLSAWSKPTPTPAPTSTPDATANALEPQEVTNVKGSVGARKSTGARGLADARDSVDVSEVRGARDARDAQPVSALKSRTVYWHFAGQLSSKARQIVSDHYALSFPDHIYGERALRRHLKRALASRVSKWKADPDQTLTSALEACTLLLIPKRAPECDLQALLRDTLELKARVYLYAFVKEGQRYVKMALTDERGELKTYQAHGPELKTVLYSVINRAFNASSYQIDGVPSVAQVSINGQKIGVGSGPHALPAGTHDVEVKTARYQTYKTRITLASGQRLVESVKLVHSFSTLSIVIAERETLRDLKLTLDGSPITLKQLEAPLELDPGMHTVSCAARDRQTLTQSFKVKAGEGIEWEVVLSYDRAPWKLALREPAPVTNTPHQLLSFSLISQGLSAGEWGADVSKFQAETLAESPDMMRAQADAFRGFGFDIDLTWVLERDRGSGALRLDLLGFSYVYHGGGEVGSVARLSARQLVSMNTRYELSGLHRAQTRFVWPGYQLSFGAFTSYVQAGLLWAYESGEISASGQGEGEVTRHSLRVGWELGLMYHFTRQWAVRSAFAGDVGDDRNAVRGTLGVVFATDLF